MVSLSSYNAPAARPMSTLPAFASALAVDTDLLTTIRRDIHAHPELCFEELRTSDLVARQLTDWGIEVHRGLGRTGLVAACALIDHGLSAQEAITAVRACRGPRAIETREQEAFVRGWGRGGAAS